MAIDWAKRDEKVARKLALISACHPKETYTQIGKALRALFYFGFEEAKASARREVEWCGRCEGRGYRKVAHYSVHALCACHTRYTKEICGCKRGSELKRDLPWLVHSAYPVESAATPTKSHWRVPPAPIARGSPYSGINKSATDNSIGEP